jgi:hypothetical protein
MVISPLVSIRWIMAVRLSAFGLTSCYVEIVKRPYNAIASGPIAVFVCFLIRSLVWQQVVQVLLV